MTNLSPQAQAVWDAFDQDAQEIEAVAAVLRAAADRAIRGPEHYEGLRLDDYDNGWNEALGYIMSIAAELESLS